MKVLIVSDTHRNEDNLIEVSKSEMSERYSNFYKIDDVEVAFATHKNQLVTEALFNISVYFVSTLFSFAVIALNDGAPVLMLNAL